MAAADSSKKLLDAAAKGDADAVHALLPSSLEKDVQLALRAAAKHGHDAVAEVLLASKAMDSADARGRTALSWAAGNGHNKVVKLLLDHDHGHLNSRDTKFGQTPLSWAAERGRARVVRLLVAHTGVEADIPDFNGQTPLAWAAEKGYTSVVKLLLASGRVDVNGRDKGGRTPLWYAANNGCDAVVQALLAHHPAALLDARDNGCRSPLWWAATRGHVAVVKQLLDHGADINASVSSYIDHNKYREEENGTALFTVGLFGLTDMFMLLLERGADVNAHDGSWSLLFHLYFGRKQVQALIPHVLARGADPNWRDEYLQTLLHLAARDGSLDTTRWLLESGADLEARTEGGLTPLGYAVTRGRYKMTTLLLEHGAQIEAADQYGNRPLHTIAATAARERGSFRVLELLLTKGGADATATNCFGQTALHHAVQAGGGGSIDGGSDSDGGDSDSGDSDSDSDSDGGDSDGSDSNGSDSDRSDSDGSDNDIGDNDSGSEIDVAIGLEAVVRLLLKHGANPNERDQNGRLPLDVVRAPDRTRTPVLEELLKSEGIKKESPYVRYL